METIWIIIGGYLLGSVLFGEVFLRLLKKKDIRKEGSDGNPGTFNAFAKGGMVCGILTLLCDLGKGALPVYLYLHFNGQRPLDMTLAFVMLAPVLGHAFPVYNGFKGGGKAIAVSFGVLLGFFPYAVPALIPAVFYLLYSALKVQPHSKRSILTYSCSTAASLFLLKESAIKLGMALISSVVVGKHIRAEHLCRENRLEKVK